MCYNQKKKKTRRVSTSLSGMHKNEKGTRGQNKKLYEWECRKRKKNKTCNKVVCIRLDCHNGGKCSKVIIFQTFGKYGLCLSSNALRRIHFSILPRSGLTCHHKYMAVINRYKFKSTNFSAMFHLIPYRDN